ncbi:hypothetical protein ACWKTQ_33600 [Bacillus thuringiensis]
MWRGWLKFTDKDRNGHEVSDWYYFFDTRSAQIYGMPLGHRVEQSDRKGKLHTMYRGCFDLTEQPPGTPVPGREHSRFDSSGRWLGNGC